MNREAMGRIVWHALSSQITHTIHCTDPEHERQNSCASFTDDQYNYLMSEIDKYVERVVAQRIDAEHRIMQHQAFDVLKSAIAVGQWSQVRTKMLKDEENDKTN